MENIYTRLHPVPVQSVDGNNAITGCPDLPIHPEPLFFSLLIDCRMKTHKELIPYVISGSFFCSLVERVSFLLSTHPSYPGLYLWKQLPIKHSNQ